ncbi:MAG: phosphotransferase [Candidatus Levybacteria bacterium]|nr:phosphotransferase [Candidatus Levybacteria bacterium]
MNSPEHPQSERHILSQINIAELKSTNTFLISETNDISVLQSDNGKRYVKRSLADYENNHTVLINYLATQEFPAVGFVGTVRGRTMHEQAMHMRRLALLRLGSAVPVYTDETSMLYPYIEGETLRAKLEQGETDSILPTLNSIKRGHNLGLRHGDRHPRNIIIQPDGNVMHIDFEVATHGPDAENLELTHLIYAMAGVSSKFEETTALVGQFTEDQRDRYDWGRIAVLMQNYDIYLREHPVGKFKKTKIPRLGEKLPFVLNTIAR